nr:terminase small subunit [Virgibacillus natechei]
MTEKQRKFVDYYIETGNAEESAKRAGYSARGNTTKLLQNTTILQYMDKQMKKLADKRIMGQREALELLTSIGRGEMKEEVYMSTEMGIERIEKIPDIRDRQKAVEALLKRYPVNEYEELKNEQLRNQIKKLEAETQNEVTGDNRVIIVNDKESMRKAIEDE